MALANGQRMQTAMRLRHLRDDAKKTPQWTRSKDVHLALALVACLYRRKCQVAENDVVVAAATVVEIALVDHTLHVQMGWDVIRLIGWLLLAFALVSRRDCANHGELNVDGNAAVAVADIARAVHL